MAFMLKEKRGFSGLDRPGDRRDDEGFRMNRAVVECTHFHLEDRELKRGTQLLAPPPRGLDHFDLERLAFAQRRKWR